MKGFTSLFYEHTKTTLTKKYYSKLQFTIVNYSLLQYHSFFHSSIVVISIVNQSSIVFGKISQFFPQFFHSFIVLFIVPQFFHSKKFLSYNFFLKNFNNLAYYHCFRSAIVLGIVSQFCPEYHSFFHSVIVFHSKSKFHSTIVLKYSILQFTIVLFCKGRDT